jgi:single-strand DNA-binding protein
VEGKLKKRSWQDKENITRYTTEIIADELNILSRPEGEKPTNTSNNYTNEGTPAPPVKIDELKKDGTDDLPF